MLARELKVVMAILLLVFPAACKSVSEEDRIREAIAFMASAIEQRHARNFIGFVHEDFQDQRGRSRSELRGLVNAYLVRNQKVNTIYTINHIVVNDGQALVELTVHVTGGRGMLPEKIGRIEVRSDWRKEGGDWLLYRANWERQPLLG